MITKIVLIKKIWREKTVSVALIVYSIVVRGWKISKPIVWELIRLISILVKETYPKVRWWLRRRTIRLIKKLILLTEVSLVFIQDLIIFLYRQPFIRPFLHIFGKVTNQWLYQQSVGRVTRWYRALDLVGRRRAQALSFLSSLSVLILFISYSFFSPSFSLAATFGWIQTSWLGGASGTAATHTSNRTDWTYYNSASSSLTFGTEVSVTSTSSQVVHTVNADFDTGTVSDTSVAFDQVTLATELSFTDWSNKEIGSYNTLGSAYDVAISDDSNYAYVADGTSAISVLNISDKTNPTFDETYNTGGTTRGVMVVGNYLYAAVTTVGLKIIDITTPGSPSAVGGVDTAGSAYNVVVDGNYAYVADLGSGLQIVDISNPASPTIVGNYDSVNNIYDVDVSGNYAYLAGHSGGTQVIDISTKTSPTLIKTIAVETAGDLHLNLDISGNYLYVAAGTVLDIIDITDPVNAVRLTSIKRSYNTIRDVQIIGNYAITANYGPEYGVYDISTPSQPKLVGAGRVTISAGTDYLEGIYASGNYAYVSKTTGGISIINISSIAGLDLTGYTATTTQSWGVAAAGDYAYLFGGDTNSGTKVFDISDPTNPTFVKFLNTNLPYTGRIFGDYIYSGSNLTITDISSTPNISIIGTGSLATSFLNLETYVSGNYAYVANSTAGLQIFDISNKASPSLVGTYNSAGDARSVVVSGNYAYLADSATGLLVVDISNKASPTLAGSYDTGTAYRVQISGNYAYVADAGGLVVVDISTPTSPSLAASLAVGSNLGLRLSGDYVYLANNSYAEAVVVNISNPTSPKLATRSLVTGSNGSTGGLTVRDVYLSGNYLFTAADAGGLNLFQNSTYLASGSFVSSIIDTEANATFDTMSWTETVPTGTTLTVKVRTSDSADMTGATAWSSCDALTNGADITANNCVNDTDRYIQYQLSMSTTNPAASPIVEDVTINYTGYPADESFISSAFNSEDPTNVVGDLAWTETVPAGTDLKFQIRTSADGTTWTEWLGPTDSSDYYTLAAGENTINSTHADGQNDQWMQYRATFISDGSNPATLSDVTLTYVVNVSPEFSMMPIVSQQASDGYVSIQYAVRDPDTSSAGASCPNCLVPSFQYSLNNGSSWTNITAGLSASETATTTGIDEVTYSTSTITWDAKAQIDGTYSETVKIKVIVDDQEGANNIASSTSATFTLDVKDPEPTGNLVVIATTTPASLRLGATDDSTVEMCVTLDNTQTNCLPSATTAAIALSSDPDRTYVIYRDTYKNTTSVYVDTVTTPANIVIRDVSNVSSSDYQEFVVWQAASAGMSPAFNHYEVWRSTDGTNYSLVSTINTRTINYYLDQTLSNSTTYYYKIYTVDANGNTSYFSSAVSDLPNGQGGTDTTPPTITGVTVSTTTTQSATIVWNTDELANSTVNYGVSTSTINLSTGVTTMVDNASSLGQHSVVLTNLTPNTTYYFEVESSDISNESSTNNNGGDYYSFTTKAGPVISGTTVTSLFNTGATIVWETDVADDSYIVYSTNADMSGSSQVGVSESVTGHSYSLTGLTSGTTYYYYVKSGVATDDNAGAYYNFVTSSDTVGPAISSVTESIITDEEVVITWTTNEDSTSAVAIGTSSGVYTATTTVSALTTSHSVTVENLATSTVYYYRVNSVDASGNSTFSDGHTFTTLETLSEESEVIAREAIANAAGQASASTSSGGGGGGSSTDKTSPSISGIQVSEIESSTASVTWTTNELSTSFVEFGVVDGSFDGIFGSLDFVSSHQVKLKNLDPETTYYYQVVSIDDAGNEARSGSGQFTTTNKSEDLEVTDSVVENISNEEAIFKWVTSRETDSVVKYTPYRNGVLSVEEAKTIHDKNFTTIHQIKVDDFEGGVIYDVELSGTDQAGQKIVKRIPNFTTANDDLPPNIYQVRTESALSLGSKIKVQSIISWLTNEPTTGEVMYQKGIVNADSKNWEMVEPDKSYSKKHVAVVTKFEPGTVYSFIIKSSDSGNNAAVSKVYTILTPRQSETVLQIITKNFEDIFGWTRRLRGE